MTSIDSNTPDAAARPCRIWGSIRSRSSISTIWIGRRSCCARPGPLVYLDKWSVYGVARHAEVHAVLNDPATFCSSRGVGLSDFAKENAVASAEHHP